MRFTESFNKKNAHISTLKDKCEVLEANKAVNRYLTFSQNIAKIAPQLKADVYCGHGVQVLSAIHELKANVGGQTICDVIETPNMVDRLRSPGWHPSVISMIDDSNEGFLRKTDRLLTVGWALGSELNKVNSSVEVLPNYRSYAEANESDYLRRLHGIPKTDKIILCISTLSEIFGDFFL